jgi:hypothetical protein
MHLCRRAFIRYTAAIKEAEADKDGIAIEGVFDLDCVAPQTAKRGVKNPITIRATRSHTQCILLKLCCSLLRRPFDTRLSFHQLPFQEQNTNSDNLKCFEGHVHSIRKTEVGLRFHTSFNKINKGKRFHIRFKLNRLPIWRQHQALGSAIFPPLIESDNPWTTIQQLKPSPYEPTATITRPLSF